MNLPIIKYRWAWYSLSLIVAAISLAALVSYGLLFGIDFKGGSLLSVTWEGDRPQSDAIRSVFETAGLGSVNVQPLGERSHIVRFSEASEQQHTTVTNALQKLGAMREDRFEAVGPAIGKELQQKSLWSVLLVIISIALYVAWVFRNISRPVASWKYGVLTIVALFHDVFVPIGLFAILGHWMNIEVTSAFVVAILTTMGYSVNDTIVVFDRTRENITKLGSSMNFESIVNTSVNQTMARSINTSLTTLISLIPIYFFGGDSIKYFALALIVGIAAGTYSSIFIASPLLVSWYRWGKKQ